MKVGIFGGSFNPVHQQHLAIAAAALSHLDQIWFIPVFQPVHKPSDELLDYEARRRLLHLALRDNERLRVCDAEKELGGASYTVRTIKHLQANYPQDRFFLIIGGDSLADLATWRSIDELVNMVEFVVVERPGFSRKSPVAAAALHWIKTEVSPLSSTQIRKELGEGSFARNPQRLPPQVLFAIFRHNYYGAAGSVYAPVLARLETYLAEIPRGLRAHIEAVAWEAFQLAIGADIPPMKAVIAGLAHDIFRIADSQQILSWAEKADYQLGKLEVETPMLAHGAAAAGLLAHEFPHLDRDLLDALRFHTLPEPGLSNLGKILVVADTLEPSRQIPEREQLRQLPLVLEEKYARVLELKRNSSKSSS